MKLYFSTGACSLSPHIVLCESGLEFSIEKVDLRTKTTSAGKNFLDVNPKGQVPTLLLDTGDILTEGPALVQYIADQVPEKNLLAPVGQLERYKTISWLNYVATEMHKNFGPLFHADASQEAKDNAAKVLATKFAYVDSILAKQDYIAADHFTVADAYLFTVLRWQKVIPGLAKYPAIEKYMTRIEARPAVAKAISAE